MMMAEGVARQLNPKADMWVAKPSLKIDGQEPVSKQAEQALKHFSR